MEYRAEHDSMSERQVPAHALYGVQTERSRLNFPIGVGQKAMPLHACLHAKQKKSTENALFSVLSGTPDPI